MRLKEFLDGLYGQECYQVSVGIPAVRGRFFHICWLNEHPDQAGSMAHPRARTHDQGMITSPQSQPKADQWMQAQLQDLNGDIYQHYEPEA